MLHATARQPVPPRCGRFASLEPARQTTPPPRRRRGGSIPAGTIHKPRRQKYVCQSESSPGPISLPHFRGSWFVPVVAKVRPVLPLGNLNNFCDESQPHANYSAYHFYDPSAIYLHRLGLPDVFAVKPFKAQRRLSGELVHSIHPFCFLPSQHQKTLHVFSNFFLDKTGGGAGKRNITPNAISHIVRNVKA